MSPEDQLRMVTSASFSSMPERLGRVEQAVHTLQHQMKQIEDERLPHRLGTMESVVSQMRSEVAEIKDLTRDVSRQLQDGISELKGQQDRQQSFVKGILWVGSVIVLIMNFAPTIAYVIRKLVP